MSIAPLNFCSAGESERVDVVLKGEHGEAIHVQGAYADFDIDAWHRLLEDNRGGKLTCSVCIKSGGEWTRYRDFSIHVSDCPLEDYGLTYRKIAPGYGLRSV